MLNKMLIIVLIIDFYSRYGSESWKPSLSICAHFQHPVLEMGQVLVLYIACDDVNGTVCGIQSDLTVQKATTPIHNSTL